MGHGGCGESALRKTKTVGSRVSHPFRDVRLRNGGEVVVLSLLRKGRAVGVSRVPTHFAMRLRNGWGHGRGVGKCAL